MKELKSNKKKNFKKVNQKSTHQVPDTKKLLKIEKRKEAKNKKLGKKEKKAIKEELINIYKGSDGKLPDMSKIEHKKRSKTKAVLIGLVIFFAFLAGLSWLGFFLFGSHQKFSGEEVKLEVVAPEGIAGGEEITYLVKWHNGENVPLGQAEIEVRYPEKFIFLEAKPTPANSQNNYWNLGSISAGESGKIEIKGQLMGEINSLQTLQAVLIYKPADFNSNFQKVAGVTSEIKNSLLEIFLEGPDKILVNDKISYKIKYKNISEDPFQNIKIKVLYPENFVFDSSEPEGLKGENGSWLVENLEPEVEGEIEITGAFVGDIEGNKDFKAQIGFVLDDKFYLQKEVSFQAEIIKGEALVTLIVNGSNEDAAINFGNTLNYSITYKNNSQTEMKDVEIKITLETTSKYNQSFLDWTSLDDENDGSIQGVQVSPDLRDGIITWTKGQIADLSLLDPGEEGTINFQIKVKDFEDVKDWQLNNFEIKNSAEMKIGQMGDLETEPEAVESNIIVFKLNSDLEFDIFARYYNDDNIAVGSGPVPPEVDKLTAYRIFWQVTNSLHEIENIKVSTELSEDITWSGKYEIEAGSISYNGETREISWTLNRLPDDVQTIGVNFEIMVRPTADDIGKLLTLISGTTLEATDKITQGAISLASDELTSNLDGDPQVEGKGVVEK